MEADTAARLVISALDIGPDVTQMNSAPLGTEDWGTLASACLAAIARGFTRPLTEVSCRTYATYWANQRDNPQCKLDEGENPEFNSLLQRLKATTQHLDIHINVDEVDRMRQWTSTVRKEVEESARRSASVDIEVALHNWKIDQLAHRQQQLKEVIKKTILERNVDFFRNTASSLGLTLGDPTNTPYSRPVPSTGNKRTASGSAPQPAKIAKPPPLPSIPDVTPPQAAQLDVITLTAAVQTAMQPFMARLAAIEGEAMAKSKIGVGTHPNRPPPVVSQPAPDRPTPEGDQTTTGEGWVQVRSKGRKGKTGKPDQANPPLQQINLTPRLYATATAAAAATSATQNQPTQLAKPLQMAFTEVTVVRLGGSLITTREQTTRARQPDAIVREVRANMARAVAKPLPIVSGRWSLGARSRGNFVFTMRGQIEFAFVQTFEHFLTNLFPDGGQLCPNQGWTKLLAHGVLIMDNDDTIFGPDDLLQEVQTMEGLRSVYFSSSPHWIKPVEKLTSSYMSLTFAFSDPDGSVTKQLLKGKQALFGKQVQIERWIDKPLLVQCGCCHALGHIATSKSCHLPPDSVRCYICGKGHLADAHDRECSKSKQHKVAGKCDCRLLCLTCNKFGHHARERDCPAREGYRSRRPRTNNKGKGKERNPPDIPPDLPTQRPVPAYLQPFTGPEGTADEEMLDAEEDTGNIHIPQYLIPGPGLSQQEAFDRMAESAEESLESLGIPITDRLVLNEEDRERQAGEAQRRIHIDSQTAPMEAAEADRFDLAEAVAIVPQGFFYPGMPELKQRPRGSRAGNLGPGVR